MELTNSSLSKLTLVEREALLLSLTLAGFSRVSWHWADPAVENPIWGWMHDAICEHLEGVALGQIDQLLINMPPRMGKSMLIAVLFPAWVWTRNAKARFFTATHAQTLSQEFSIKSRQLVTSAWYAKRWPGVVLNSDQANMEHWTLTSGGGRLSTTIGGGVGQGGDILILDDPNALSDQFQAKDRENRMMWIDSTFLTRVNPKQKKDSVRGIVAVQQRVHEKDFSGVMIKRGGWTHLCLPNEYEPSRKCVVKLGASAVSALMRQREISRTAQLALSRMAA